MIPLTAELAPAAWPRPGPATRGGTAKAADQVPVGTGGSRHRGHVDDLRRGWVQWGRRLAVGGFLPREVGGATGVGGGWILRLMPHTGALEGGEAPFL